MKSARTHPASRRRARCSPHRAGRALLALAAAWLLVTVAVVGVHDALRPAGFSVLGVVGVLASLGFAPLEAKALPCKDFDVAYTASPFEAYAACALRPACLAFRRSETTKTWLCSEEAHTDPTLFANDVVHFAAYKRTWLGPGRASQQPQPPFESTLGGCREPWCQTFCSPFFPPPVGNGPPAKAPVGKAGFGTRGPAGSGPTDGERFMGLPEALQTMAERQRLVAAAHAYNPSVVSSGDISDPAVLVVFRISNATMCHTQQDPDEYVPTTWANHTTTSSVTGLCRLVEDAQGTGWVVDMTSCSVQDLMTSFSQHSSALPRGLAMSKSIQGLEDPRALMLGGSMYLAGAVCLEEPGKVPVPRMVFLRLQRSWGMGGPWGRWEVVDAGFLFLDKVWKAGEHLFPAKNWILIPPDNNRPSGSLEEFSFITKFPYETCQLSASLPGGARRQPFGALVCGTLPAPGAGERLGYPRALKGGSPLVALPGQHGMLCVLHSSVRIQTSGNWREYGSYFQHIAYFTSAAAVEPAWVSQPFRLQGADIEFASGLAVLGPPDGLRDRSASAAISQLRLALSYGVSDCDAGIAFFSLADVFTLPAMAPTGPDGAGPAVPGRLRGLAGGGPRPAPPVPGQLGALVARSVAQGLSGEAGGAADGDRVWPAAVDPRHSSVITVTGNFESLDSVNGKLAVQVKRDVAARFGSARVLLQCPIVTAWCPPALTNCERERVRRDVEARGLREVVVFVGPVVPDGLAAMKAPHSQLVLLRYKAFGAAHPQIFMQKPVGRSSTLRQHDISNDNDYSSLDLKYGNDGFHRSWLRRTKANLDRVCYDVGCVMSFLHDQGVS